jgi:hypothetical protein
LTGIAVLYIKPGELARFFFSPESSMVVGFAVDIKRYVIQDPKLSACFAEGFAIAENASLTIV